MIFKYKDDGSFSSADRCRKWKNLRLEIFESQILLFPMSVVVLLSFVFLFGGHCAPWIWWVAFSFVVVLPFFKYHSFHCLYHLFILLLFMALIWLLVGCSFSAVDDTMAYHMPAIRMMIDGWNPVYQATALDLTEAGYLLDEFWWIHVLSMPKSVWYFNAAAYCFFADPWNIMFPILPFLYVSAAMSLWRVMGAIHVMYKLIGSIVMFCVLPNFPLVVDEIVALAGMGLLLNMYDVLKNGRWNWTRLIVFSFWMCTAKQTGLFHCFLFWCCFAMLYLRSSVALIRLAFVGIVMLTSVCVVNASPYLTAWRNFGHPLYPKVCPADSNLSSIDITSDFLNQNEDAQRWDILGDLFVRL